ncbi:MAG: sigma-70 family RNA polymerase sigma factor, partial [Odoribacteraceae bacterium]|nr:sigma-70 family RNA polymerase sigma factor [Odoribacteraceae bacterium]
MIDLPTYTENEILERVAAGDERAFRHLFDHYQPRIYSFARYLTRSEALSEDIVQEVFMKIWIAREELRGVEYFNAYLRTIARNVAANYLKRVAHERVITRKILAATPPSTSTTEEEVLANDFQRVLDEAIASL